MLDNEQMVNMFGNCLSALVAREGGVIKISRKEIEAYPEINIFVSDDGVVITFAGSVH